MVTQGQLYKCQLADTEALEASWCTWRFRLVYLEVQRFGSGCNCVHEVQQHCHLRTEPPPNLGSVQVQFGGPEVREPDPGFTTPK